MPEVSVIVPCFNEEKTIHLLFEALLTQTYPASEMEVVIADGLSSDQTRPIIAGFQHEHPELAILVVDNPRRAIPSALNQAIRASHGEIIVRLDAHSAPRAGLYRALRIRFGAGQRR